MRFERMSMNKFCEIKRLVETSRLSDRQIARAVGCRRSVVSGIRSGKTVGDDVVRAKLAGHVRQPAPWVGRIDIERVRSDILEGHELKQIWQEQAVELTSYSNFYKFIQNRFALEIQGTVTLREFKPGEYCEVDYAGTKVPWFELATGKTHKASVFIGILCFSQKLFAHASPDQKSVHWLGSHRRMFEFFGGVPGAVVPDNLKTGVLKAHLYDPDLNQGYVEMLSHYGAGVAPARSYRPKDKALVEGAVGIVMRLFRFKYRHHKFTSIKQINTALESVVKLINERPHTRFKTSRVTRFENSEKRALKALPLEPYEVAEVKELKIHPDCTVQVDHNYYSAPQEYRGKSVRVKVTASMVSIFLDLSLIASHSRLRGKVGERVLNMEHLPPNSRAYLETSPQSILSQAKFAHPELHILIEELFYIDTLSNLRRALGLVRKATKLIEAHGREKASPWIARSISYMRLFRRYKVQIFEQQIQVAMKTAVVSAEDRTIVRIHGNPMVRGLGGGHTH